MNKKLICENCGHTLMLFVKTSRLMCLTEDGAYVWDPLDCYLNQNSLSTELSLFCSQCGETHACQMEKGHILMGKITACGHPIEKAIPIAPEVFDI